MLGRVKVGQVDFGSGESPCELWSALAMMALILMKSSLKEHLDLKSISKPCHSCGTCNMVVLCLLTMCKKRFLTRMANL